MKPVYALYVNARNNYPPYYHVIAHVVTIGPSYDGDTTPRDAIRNIRDSYPHDTKFQLADLRVYSQGNCDDQPRHMYAWEVDYHDAYTIKLHNAKKIVYTLSHIEKRLLALDAKYGKPATFGTYLARVADALGIEHFVFRQDKSNALDYDQQEHAITNISDGISNVDWLISQWVKGNTQETEVA